MKVKFSLLIIFIMAFQVLGGVNVKNGNFSITYTDVVLASDNKTPKEKLIIERTYNSRSARTGWFGYGWGSDLETFLVQVPYGYAVHINGSGVILNFQGDIVDPDAYKAALEEVVSIANTNIESEDLQQDIELRNAYWQKYSKQISNSRLEPHETFFDDMSYQVGYTLEVKENVIEVLSSEGIKYVFNRDDGQLIEYVSGATIYQLVKDDNELLIKSQSGLQITLTFENKDGLSLVSSTKSSSGDETTYEYKNGNLIAARDIANNYFEHSYDSNHNMTQIRYADGKFMNIEYSGNNQFVRALTYRDGKRIEFFYHSNLGNPEEDYSAFTYKYDAMGNMVGSDHFVYNVSKGSQGNYWVKNIKKSSNYITYGKDQVVDVTFNECCGLPEEIKFNQHNFFIEYDLSQIGLGVLIKKLYENNGQKRSIEFIYNEEGVPESFIYSGHTKIQINYDDNGEIRNLASNDGSSNTYKETELFKTWFEILNLVSGCVCLHTSKFD